MKKIIILLALATSLINCKAQQTYPLNTYYEDAPNYAYMQDLDNLLPPYAGTYKATYQGNDINLYITYKIKELIDTKLGGRKYYQDILSIKYIVKKIATGVILEDSQNTVSPNEKEIISIGTNIQDGNSIAFLYSGTTCGIGWGRITIKKINSTQINWSYYPNGSLFSDGDCPGSQNIKVYLPDTKDLVFTKQ